MNPCKVNSLKTNFIQNTIKEYLGKEIELGEMETPLYGSAFDGVDFHMFEEV